MKTIILGNGFDIDLGFPTRYKDFLESSNFKNSPYAWQSDYAANDHPSNLFRYIEKKAKEDSMWTDVENTLAEYAKRGELNIKTRLGQVTSPNVSNQEISHSYDNLTLALKNYIASIPFNEKANRFSMAYAFLKAISLYDADDLNVISFNYTLPVEIFPELNLANKIYNIHGDIRTDIILGFNDSRLYDSSYEYMVKVNGRGGMVDYLKSRISMSDEIVFFGHSLGESDRDYFQVPLSSYSKRAIFITYNYESMVEISKELNNIGAGSIMGRAEWYFTSQYANNIVIL